MGSAGLSLKDCSNGFGSRSNLDWIWGRLVRVFDKGGPPRMDIVERGSSGMVGRANEPIRI